MEQIAEKREKLRTRVSILALVALVAVVAVVYMLTDDTDYIRAKDAKALTLGTKTTIVFSEWNDAWNQYADNQYLKFTPPYSGKYDILMFNDYGTSNADDMTIKMYASPKDAYHGRDEICGEHAISVYDSAQKAKYEVYSLEEGKTYYFKFSVDSGRKEYDAYPVTIRENE